MALELTVEQHLVKRARESGGVALKLTPDGHTGIPDRLVILPGSVMFFVETKRPLRGVTKKKQLWWQRVLRRLGQSAYVCNTKDLVDEIMTIEQVTKKEVS